MNSWSPIWSGIVDSSLYEESGDVVKVFVAMLATKDSDHICRLDSYKLARKCNFKLTDGSVDELKVLDILKILASPDKRRKANQEFGGRRIKLVEDGWFILNGEKYRKMVSEEMRKARLRRAQNTYRNKEKERESGNAKELRATGMDGTPASQGFKGIETASIKARDNGDTAKAEALEQVRIK